MRASANEKTLFFIDVSHGSSAVLVDSGQVVVFDAGPGSGLLEFLRSKGISRIDTIVLSHADTDHIKGLLALLPEPGIGVGEVRVNSNSLKDTKWWDDLLWELNKRKRDGTIDLHIELTTSDTGAFDTSNVNFEIIAPSPYIAGRGAGGRDRRRRLLTSNSVSAVIRVMTDGRPVALLPGDIDNVGLCNIEEDGRDMSAQIASFPHHGGKPGHHPEGKFVRQFCRLCRPDVVVFSIGRGQHGTPRREIVEMLLRSLPQVRILCTQLSESCADQLPTTSPAHLCKEFALGRDERKCCAGTVVVDLTGGIPRVMPDQSTHTDFVKKHAPTALCRVLRVTS